MEITNKVHIRKIEVEIAKLYKNDKSKIHMSDSHEVRREKIRRTKLYNESVLKIQMAFRRFRARKELRLRRDVKRINQFEKDQRDATKLLGTWWTDRHEIPSKTLLAYDEEIIPGQMADVAKKIVPPKEVQELLKLPPLKTFGRKRDHLSCEGWGRRDGNGNWVALPQIVQDLGDYNPTRGFTTKLATKGYDRSRLDQFKGVPVRRTFNDAAFLTKFKSAEELENDRVLFEDPL